MMPRLLSVNVGLPRDIAWQGKTVHTAVWKTQVQGRRMVRRLNIDGDGQGDLAGHGGEHRAVFVYQIDAYRYWQHRLGRSDFSYGQFGENFTVDGLSDDEVCIGDRYRIGGAVFEVTQPRVTCYRVGIRMNEPQMAALLVAHGKPGFYFRVLEEGEVGAGDEIEQVAAAPERMTVSEVNALLYMPGHPRSQIERALRIPALSAGWRASFQALLDREQSAGAVTGNPGLTSAAGPPPAWTGFRPLRVSRKDRESASVISLVLEPTDGHALATALPGQFIVLRLRPAPDAPALLRSYSLSGAPRDDRYRVSIKRETAWGGWGLHRHSGPGRRRSGRERATRQLHVETRQRTRHPTECRRRRNPGAGHASCIGRRGTRRGRSGGSTLPATAASIRLRQRRASSSRLCNTATATSATALLVRRIGRVSISTLPGAWTGVRSRNLGCRAKGISIYAGRPPSWTTLPANLELGVSSPITSTPRFSVRARRRRRVSPRQRSGRRTHRPGLPASAPWCPSHGAASMSAGPQRSRASSNSLRPAMCLCGGHAGPGSATLARPGSSPALSATGRSQSNRRPMAMHSSVAANPRVTSSSIFDWATSPSSPGPLRSGRSQAVRYALQNSNAICRRVRSRSARFFSRSARFSINGTASHLRKHR